MQINKELKDHFKSWPGKLCNPNTLHTTEKNCVTVSHISEISIPIYLQKIFLLIWKQLFFTFYTY